MGRRKGVMDQGRKQEGLAELTCWKILRCGREGCPAYNRNRPRCWLIDGTLCFGRRKHSLWEKRFLCPSCRVFQHNAPMVGTREALEIVRDHVDCSDEDTRLGGCSDAECRLQLAAGLAEVLRALERLSPASSKGGALFEPEDSLAGLREVLRESGKEIATQSDVTDDLRQGLAEHFEVIRRIGQGDYSARVEGRYSAAILQALSSEMNAMLQAVAAEVAARKEMEDTLRRNEERLYNIIDFLPDATFVIDAEKRVIAWNRAIEEMTGWRKEDVLGKGDYIYGCAFYDEPRPILIDLIFDENRGIEEQYDFIQREEKTIFTEVYIPKAYSNRGAYVWGKASALYDKEGKFVGAIESVRDISDRKETEDRLRYMSFHDSLTGLCNRNYFIQEMQRHSQTSSLPVGIIVCDVDGLKEINDTLGHEHGDRLLQSAAKIIRDSFRSRDIVARIGGDEFAVLLLDCKEKDVQGALIRMESNMRSGILDPQASPTISYGYAVCSSGPVNLEALFQEADNNMYAMKKKNKALQIRGSTSMPSR